MLKVVSPRKQTANVSTRSASSSHEQQQPHISHRAAREPPSVSSLMGPPGGVRRPAFPPHLMILALARAQKGVNG